MTWYLLLLLISTCVLIGQTILSFIGGELEGIRTSISLCGKYDKYKVEL